MSSCFIDDSTYKRIESEQIELQKKIEELQKYLQSNPQRIIGDFQTNLLIQQFNSMCEYNNILCIRLNSLEVKGGF